LGAFNQTVSLKPIHVDFSGVANLFNTSIECSESTTTPISLNASASLDVGANVQVSIILGAIAAGTIVPPTITEFELDFGVLYSAGLPKKNIDEVDYLCVVLDGNVGANLSVVANISGDVSSGSITLFQIDIPGLGFPG
jgi:hypothetical protein